MSDKIAVIGAAGVTGRAAVRQLTRRGATVRALVHRLEQEQAVREAGAAEVAVIELDDEDTLAPALSDVTAILHIPSAFNVREPQQVGAVVDAASKSGVERFVFHSVMHPATPELRHHQRKVVSEAILRHSALRWTILQPSMYAETMLRFWGHSTEEPVAIPFTLESRITPVALEDLAEATAIVLTEDGHEFATYELAGPEVLTAGEMLSIMMRVFGVERTVRRSQVNDLAGPPGLSASQRADMVAMFAHYDEVGFRGGSRVLEMLLGRAPTPFATAIASDR
jgi:uncharacterized protein YbjT (DUF2867 family)